MGGSFEKTAGGSGCLIEDRLGKLSVWENYGDVIKNRS